MFPSKVTHVHSPRLFGLDFLRALAIAAVVVSHGFAFRATPAVVVRFSRS
jgi:peptidoglycan/LPS O-acetylase OafA/YrhL